MKFTDSAGVDVYPVGLLRDLRQFKGRLRHPPIGQRSAWGRLLYDLRYPLRLLRRGEWRALRMYLNGYLAEPSPWPAGLRRCGSGWTRRRALSSLQRHIERGGR